MVMVVKDYNKYDYFILALIGTLCFGDIGGPVRVVRVLAILFIPLFFRLLNKNGCGYVRKAFKILSIIYCYMLLSFIWTPDKEEAVKELVYYPIHFFLFLELILFSRFARNPIRSIRNGWLIAVLTCSMVAFWEITTGNHLSMALQTSDVANLGTEVVKRMCASVTFGNYNGYVTFLCYGFPWIFFCLIEGGRGGFEKLLSFILLVFSFLTIIINASRGGLLAVSVMLLVYYFLTKKTFVKNVTLACFILLAAYLLINYGSVLTAVMAARASDGGLFSDNARSEIWSNALLAFFSSFGFGTGIGSIDVAMSRFARGGITSPHNMFFEMLVQYGIIITFMFVRFLWRLFVRARQIENNRMIVMMMALIAMPLYSIINSGYLLHPHFYVLLASMYVFVYLGKIKSPAQEQCFGRINDKK